MAVKETLLFFVDDDPDDHMIFADVISREFTGITLTYFFSARELFKHLDTETAAVPDAIILDYNMPMVNGLACLHELKQMPIFAAIPVIIYSTSGYPSAAETAINAGAWKYEVKGDYRDTQELVQSIIELKKT